MPTRAETSFPTARGPRWFLGWTLAIAGVIVLQGWWQRSVVIDPDWLLPLDRSLLFEDLPAAALMVAMVAVLLACVGRMCDCRLSRWEGVAGWFSIHRWIVAGMLVAGLAGSSLWVYRAHPFSMDEAAMVFQARVFATGQRSARLDPEVLDWAVPARFQQHHFATNRDTGRVIARYWPGFSLLLVPFVWLGCPWLLNPLLAGVAVLLIAAVVRQVDPNPNVVGLAILLAIASPQFTVTAISFYPMTAHLVANLAWVLLLLRGGVARAFWAGLLGGFALVLHQPLPHFLFALPWFLWLAASRPRWRELVALLCGYFPAGLGIGVGWSQLRLKLTAPSATFGTAVEPTFDASAWLTLKGAANMLRMPNASVLADRWVELEKLFLWAVPGLLLLAVLGALVFRRVAAVRLLAASAALTFFAYSLVPFNQTHGWGDRYFHQAWAVLPMLAALAVGGAGRERRRWFFAVVALALMSLVAGTGLRFSQVSSRIGEHLSQLPPVAAAGRHIAFIDTSKGYFRFDLVQNDPQLRGPLLVFESQGRDRDLALLRTKFPGAELAYDDGVDTLWRRRDD